MRKKQAVSSPGRALWPAFLILVTCLGGVGLLSHSLRGRIRAQRQAEFNNACNVIRDRAELQFTYHLALLSGMRGFLVARTNITLDEFRRCLASLDLTADTNSKPTSVPGLTDLGFALRVRRDEVDAHVSRIRSQGFKDYQAYLGGPGPDHFPIVHIEDFFPDAQTCAGWDMASEPLRRAALEKARDTGNAVATAPLTLHARPSARSVPGFLVFLPVYASGTTPPTVAMRREQLIGFTFVSLENTAFWGSVDAADGVGVNLLVYDGPKLVTEKLIYPAKDAPNLQRNAQFIDGFSADGVGRSWSFFFASGREFEQVPGSYVALLVEVLGALASLGLFSIAWVLIRARCSAESMASRIQASETRFRRIFDSIQDVYFRTDLGGRIDLVSPSSHAVLGYRPEELVGHSALEVYADPSSRPAFLERLVANGQVTDHEMVLVRKDGKPIHVSVTAQLLRDDNGQPSGCEGSVRDITVRRRAELERQRSNKLESVGLLAGGIAHDFNNLLGAILGHLGLLRLESSRGVDPTDSLAEIENAALRAKDLTQQLLTFAKGGEPIRKPVSLTQLLRNTLETTLRGSTLHTRFEIDADLWPADVDEAQIHWVLQNLGRHAVRAQPHGGSLSVRAKNAALAADAIPDLTEGSYVHCTLTDASAGLSPDRLQHIFDPYFIDPGAEAAPGQGLGLATAYSIVRRHKGRLTAESIPGRGTTFHVWLPACPGARVDRPAAAEPPPAGTTRVLIVDDEAPLRSVLSRFLTRLGYEVTTATGGREAIELVRARQQENKPPFDVAILDLTIPGDIGGQETLPRLREIQPGLAAIVSSGYSSDPVMANHRAHGFDGVLAKPYHPKDLAELLAKILAAHRSHRESRHSRPSQS